MKLEKIKGFLSLSRLINCFISFCSVIIIVLFVSQINNVSLSSIFFKTILGALSVFLITAGGNAVNDYYDVKSDRINKPNRPIPSKIITKKEALYFTSVVFSFGLAFSLFVNIYAFFIALFNIFLLIAYSGLKQKTIFGNFIVAYLCGSVFLYTATILMVNFKLFIIFFLLAFLLMLGREITKDIEDVKGDKNRKKTIATQFSVKHAGALSALTLSTSVIVSLILTDYFGRIYIITIFFADTILLYCIIRLLFHPYKYASECQRLEKIAVIIMLLGLFLSSMM